MQNSYIPKASQEEFCQWIDLCTVRKNEEWINKIGVKKLDGTIYEDLLDNVLDKESYEWKEIVRIYSSGHVFLSDDNEKVFLVTTQKDGKSQHQFTGWSPLEEENKNVIFKENWVYKFDIEKVRNNARIRTKNRTWVDITEEYNQRPIVDWALMENMEDEKIYYKIVCLMHFVVKKFDGILGFTDSEYVIDWQWYKIDELPNTPNVAPNAYIVSKNARDLVRNLGDN